MRDFAKRFGLIGYCGPFAFTVIVVNCLVALLGVLIFLRHSPVVCWSGIVLIALVLGVSVANRLRDAGVRWARLGACLLIPVLVNVVLIVVLLLFVRDTTILAWGGTFSLSLLVVAIIVVLTFLYRKSRYGEIKEMIRQVKKGQCQIEKAKRWAHDWLIAEPENTQAKMLYGICCQISGDSQTFLKIGADIQRQMNWTAMSHEERLLWRKYCKIGLLVSGIGTAVAGGVLCFYGEQIACNFRTMVGRGDSPPPMVGIIREPTGPTGNGAMLSRESEAQ